MFVPPTYRPAVGCSVEVFPESKDFDTGVSSVSLSLSKHKIMPSCFKSNTPMVCLCGGSNKHSRISDVQTEKSEQNLQIQSSVYTEVRNYCRELKAGLTCNHTEHEAKACVWLCGALGTT